MELICIVMDRYSDAEWDYWGVMCLTVSQFKLIRFGGGAAGLLFIQGTQQSASFVCLTHPVRMLVVGHVRSLP